MQIDPNLSAAIITRIVRAKRIAIGSHRNPDADTIGSNLALKEILQAMDKDVISVCVDPIPIELFFLRQADQYKATFDTKPTVLFIGVDCRSPSQAVFPEKVLELINHQIDIINIDHHASNKNFGTLNLVMPEAAAACLILFYLFKSWQLPLTKTIATALLAGLCYDTGSFMHSNTTNDVYEAASELVRAGADAAKIAKILYHNHTINRLKIYGALLESAKANDKNILIGGLTQEDFKKNNSTIGDVSGAIDYLNQATGHEFTTMLLEDEKGNIRGSFRTKKDDHNLSEIAALFGGGGHPKASGFTIKGRLKKEVVWSIKSD